ncbi:MAG: TIGR01777 family oxidoreductase [Bacteroidetes bacterium]|nr:TIGR01777 family oxidoreductase [Bacteroidota bacterium]MBS1942241.1 TIGR01777 family oxidoreductase [Bacteroidota bacterium]
METVLITGGSGLIGSHLTKLLVAEGFTVRHLSRNNKPNAPVSTFSWDITKGLIDPRALQGVDHIIHLSGANLAGKRWTRARKQELLASRANAADLLREATAKAGTWPQTFISASGVNYYGTVTADHIFTEEEPAAGDFLGQLCRAWEAAADAWKPHCRVVKLRTPVVLARTGGALEKMAAPARMGLAAPLGSGKQWMPWVHIDDLARAYLHAIQRKDLQGAFNVAAPEQVRNLEFMHVLAKVLKRPFFLPPVPGLLLRMVLDGPGNLILNGSRAATGKLERTGFRYQFPQLKNALADLLG